MSLARQKLLESDSITLETFDAARPWELTGLKPPAELKLRCPAGKSWAKYKPGVSPHRFCDPDSEIVEGVLWSSQDVEEEISPFMLLEETILTVLPYQSVDWWNKKEKNYPKWTVARLSVIAIAASWNKRSQGPMVRSGIESLLLATEKDFCDTSIQACEAASLGMQRHHAAMMARDIASVAHNEVERFISILATTPAFRGYPIESVLSVGLGREIYTDNPWLQAYGRWLNNRLKEQGKR